MASSTDAMSPPFTLRESTTALPVAGVRLATAASGLRYRGRDDLCLIELAAGTATAGLFTRNRFCAAPVKIARAHLANAAPRYLVVNAGNANAGTGRAEGRRRWRCATRSPPTPGCATTAVLPFSTGVIGQQLDAARWPSRFRRCSARCAQAWPAAAAAIMTTDTRAKLRSAEVECGDRATSSPV